MKPASLTRRLITVVVLSQLLLAGGLLGVGAWFVWHEQMRAFDTALRGRALELAALVEYRDQGRSLQFDAALAPPPSDPAHPDRYEIHALQTGPGGTRDLLLGRSPGRLPARVLHATASGTVRFQAGGVPFHALALLSTPVLDPELNVPKRHFRLNIFVASPVLELQHRLAAAMITIGLASLAFLLLSAVLAAWAIRRRLQPLRQLAQEAAGISVHNWRFAPHSEAAATAELAPLAQALERMLAGLQSAFQRQHEFLADAAHELKTPVAVLKSSLQLLLRRERSGEEYRAWTERSLEDVDRLQTLVERMLQLARAEQPDGAARRIQPALALAPGCEAAIEQLQPLAAQRRVHLELAAEAGATATADPEELELVWRNLLDNAIRHSPAGGRVRLCCRALEAGAEVVVEDEGEGIAAAQLPHLFERFHRGDPSRARSTGGFGLGLAICKAVIEANRGSISLASTPGRGTRVVIRLPPTGATGGKNGEPHAAAPAARAEGASGGSLEEPGAPAGGPCRESMPALRATSGSDPE